VNEVVKHNGYARQYGSEDQNYFVQDLHYFVNEAVKQKGFALQYGSKVRSTSCRSPSSRMDWRLSMLPSISTTS
jgi:hypothetical protein